MIACVRYAARPWTTNAERSENRWKHRSATYDFKSSTRWLLRSLRLPPFVRVHVIGLFDVAHPLPDPGNNYGAIKAMLDAVVEENLLASDRSANVLSITMFAPTLVPADRQGVTLVLNDTDRNPWCEDCNKTVARLLEENEHGGKCMCALPHEGTIPVPQPKRGRTR
jgi:hypothetical protein